MDFLYGECRTLEDTVEFIHFKAYDGWHVMCSPFQSPITHEWCFILYKYKEEVYDE